MSNVSIPSAPAPVVFITRLFDACDPRNDWSLEFARGKPGLILVQAARQARLLVVGTGEHVGLGRVLLGSTSHYCLSHASCPVVAVPGVVAAVDDQTSSVSAVSEASPA